MPARCAPWSSSYRASEGIERRACSAQCLPIVLGSLREPLYLRDRMGRETKTGKACGLARLVPSRSECANCSAHSPLPRLVERLDLDQPVVVIAADPEGHG